MEIAHRRYITRLQFKEALIDQYGVSAEDEKDIALNKLFTIGNLNYDLSIR